MFAQRPSVGVFNDPVGRAPSQIESIAPRVPAQYAGGGYIAWEGFNSTNYLNRVELQYSPNFAEIATGPTDILTVVNRRIARWRNPKAMGISPVQTNEGPSNEALLDAWLGVPLLKYVCPTEPRSAFSCLIENASVRYDQMHGRFVVLMAVTDTGIQAFGYQATAPRKATWVLAISKYATFVTGGPSSSDLFIYPTPPQGNTSGTAGWNTDNWVFYWGDTADTYGNINTATDAAGSPAASVVVRSAPFNCAVGAATTNSACYFPTSARLGLDNDNVIVTSAVINSNLVQANPTADPTAATPSIAAFSGTRVRVFKKTYLYTSRLADAAVQPAPSGNIGSSGGVGGAAQIPDYLADYYDLYALKAPGTVPGIGLPLGPADFAAPAVYSPYTFAPPGVETVAPATAATVVALFCEPQHLRGRPASSPANALVGGASTSYLVCAQATNSRAATAAYPTGTPVDRLYVQPIAYTVPPANVQLANTNPNSFGVAFAPSLVGIAQAANTAYAGIIGTLQVAIVSPFADPTTVPQAAARDTTPAPNLYVGDNRPQKVVFREGHLYETHAAWSPNDGQVGAINQVTSNSTVQYTIIQALTPGAAQATKKVVLRAQWWNTWAWAPMYEVPANVSLSGQVSPINMFPWLEKLFVATTYPALSLTDPRVAVQADGTTICSGPPSPAYDPSNPSTTASAAYAGLYDMRCGTDAYDARKAYRDPIRGHLIIPGPGGAQVAPQTVTLSTRNGAAIDPNDGSLWNYGLYATRRFTSVVGAGQWSTYVANYNLAVQTAQSDPYGNGVLDYANDPIKAGHAFYVPVQIARNVGIIAQPSATVTTVVPSNTSISAGGGGNSDTVISRAEMAKLIMTSLMDETAITNFLNATGGCNNNFADVTSGCTVGSAVTNATGLLTLNAAGSPNGSGWRYIESMYRRGITKGCYANAATRGFCPDRPLTRGEMAVFIIRAKMNNVFTTSLNGCPVANMPACRGGAGNNAGDGFGLFVAANLQRTTPLGNSTAGYFCDSSATATPSTCGTNITNDEFWLYIQKMFEMRISNGTTLPQINADNSISIANQGEFGRDRNITRGEVLVFVVRAFFY